MKTGNKTQAIVLSVAAVGAIGFMVSKFMPAKAQDAQANGGTSRGSGGRSAMFDGLPTEIVRDAFSHPALAERYAMTKQVKGGQDSAIDIPPVAVVDEFEGPLPPALGRDGLSGQIPKHIPSQKSKPNARKPSGNTEIDQQEDKTVRSKIDLKAIMSATKSLALISVDGGPDLMVGPGEQLTARYRIGKFSHNAVQLISATEKFWVYVGQEVEK